ncbi:MAG TPA: AI-2E family transporter [Longilinea sp.]|nr:AI-2E family transporter [Longilinea sp.]
MTKRLILSAMAVMTTLLVLVVLWQFRIVIVYALISVMLAAVLRPLANRLAGRGYLVKAGLIFLYLVTLAGFSFFLFLTGKSAVSDIQQVAHTVSVQDGWRLPVWLAGSSFQNTLLARLPPPSKIFEAVTGSQGQLVLPALLGITQGISGTVSGLFIILFLSIYWSISQTSFERLWLSLLPSEQRKQARGIWRRVEPDVGAYIRSEVILSILAGLLLALGYWLLGSPYPALLALIGALTCLIPVVGVVLAIIPVVMLGFLTSIQLSLFTGLYTLIVLVALRVWVKPRLSKRRWENPILTIVLLLVLAKAFGLVGIIIAPPISVVCQILWARLVSHRLVSGAATQLSDLKERQERIWDIIKAMDEPPPPLATSSMERLTQLIAKAEPLLPAAQPGEHPGQLPLVGSQPAQEVPDGSK